jgi:hypothetical protein
MTTDEEYLTNNFNKFIKKWCGNNYAHLIDTDENDGEGFRGDIILTIDKVRQEERAKVLAEVKAEWNKLLVEFDNLKEISQDKNMYSLVRFCEARVLLHEFVKKVFEDGNKTKE